MERITRDMFNTVIDDFELTKVCSVKSDSDSNDSKKVTLKVKYHNVTIQDLANATLGQGVVVKWQNGPGRKNHASWKNGQVIEVNFTSPGSSQVDAKTALIMEAQAAGIDTSDKVAFSDWLSKKFNI